MQYHHSPEREFWISNRFMCPPRCLSHDLTQPPKSALLLSSCFQCCHLYASNNFASKPQSHLIPISPTSIPPHPAFLWLCGTLRWPHDFNSPVATPGIMLFGKREMTGRAWGSNLTKELFQSKVFSSRWQKKTSETVKAEEYCIVVGFEDGGHIQGWVSIFKGLRVTPS